MTSAALPHGRASDTEHSALELLQAQVVLQFASVFEQIDLGMAVSSETDRNSMLEIFISRNHSVAEVSLSCWTGADQRAGISKRANRLGCHVNRVHRRE